VAHVLARFQRRALLRIATRDLLGFADTAAAAGELADLAAGVVAAALDHVQTHTEADRGTARLAVIGMGKLGGCELNYVSDIDVVFVYEGSRETASWMAGRLLSLLGAMTPLGHTYDVDTNLRPEGRDGPLVRTIEGYGAYYRRWARTWEQQALLKARPIAGARDLGSAFMDMVGPHVWPDRRAADTVVDIQTMKGVVERSAPVQRAGGREVKLAPGGLRDIEFAVQLLQLVHGRHDDRLRSGNTLDALTALAGCGYVDGGDANLFSDAYLFLRTVEHRLQLRRLRRTHVVPDRDTERYRLARSCGFRDLRTSTALEQFDRELSRVQGSVRRLHEKLFYRPLLERFAEVSGDEARTVGGGSVGFDDAAAAERLAALGFTSPGRSMNHLQALATGSTRAAVLLRNALPTMLTTLAEGPDPDAGLLALRTMSERLEHAPSFVSAMRDAPPVGQILATVLSRSRLVGEWLERQPELFKTLADPSALDDPLDAHAYRRVALGLVRRGGDDRRVADALRRFKRREVARIAVRDLTERASPEVVAGELTGLADACLEAALASVVTDVNNADAVDIRLAVIALGKLGGGELGYGSDLDVILVFEPSERRADALNAVERVLRMLSSITPEGQAFAVDMKLRPEGKDGPMARTLSSTVNYYERWAQPWELFALTQARVVAGDTDLGAAFLDGVRPLVWPERTDETYLRSIRTMKARIEKERARGSKARNSVDVKLGSGGLSDIEWTMQLLAVAHHRKAEGLRRPGVLAPMTAAVEAGALPGEESVWLRHAWRLLTRVRNARYLAGARRTDEVPMDSASLAQLSAMIGYARPGAQRLGEDLNRVMRRVRAVHERRFYT
jgi:glutamate-ammonia-ligase adenylyltransferase